jgi:exopolyphosphatase/guanosine-5'-triphosphate,3'-diphosphate pyrophosphatase
MTTAVIDLGTNTFNLLITTDAGQVIFNDKIPVKLGKGGIHQNRIAPDAFQRGLHALERYRDICKLKEVDQVFAFATSAVRSATNANEFIEAAAEECGININVIDGNREALFIYEGVAKAIPITETTLIVDIGGGSTEFVIASKKGVLWQASYPLGVSRLLETFTPDDPLTSTDVEKLNDHFENTLAEMLREVRTHKPTRMVGSSGSFETIHDICALRFNHSVVAPGQASSRIYLHELNIITEQLLHSALTDRLVVPGMLAMRADTLHLSALQIKFVLEKTGIQELLLSLFALKEGVIASINKSHETWLKSSL